MNCQSCVLFRPDSSNYDEYKICKNIISTETQRSKLNNKFVVGRFSVLPFYKELEEDLKVNGCTLVNSYKEHKYIADFLYYDDVKEFTFPTYFDSYRLPEDKYVVKGVTNSRKHEWNTLMFAENKRRAIEISCDLKLDSLLRTQDIIFRKYIPLQTLEYGLNGLPITNEWRLFYFNNDLIAYGFYWSCVEDNVVKSLLDDFRGNGIKFANHVASILSNKATFFVIDVAKTQSGEWILVECNDAQMSGLNTIDPKLFYTSLKGALDDFKNV
jgi:hypothetical protein